MRNMVKGPSRVFSVSQRLSGKAKLGKNDAKLKNHHWGSHQWQQGLLRGAVSTYQHYKHGPYTSPLPPTSWHHHVLTCCCFHNLFLLILTFWNLTLLIEWFCWETILGKLAWVSASVLRMASGVFTGFFHAPRIPGPDAGEGTLSKSHSAGTPWTSILEAGRSAILHCSPHETIQASLSRGFV